MPPFASVWWASDPTAEFPLGPADPGAALELNARGVVLKGNVAASELPLYPTTAFVVADCLIPRPGAHLRWTDGKSNALHVVLEVDKRVALVGIPLETDQPCTNLALYEAAFDPTVGMDPPLKGVDLRLRGKRKITLAKTPGGPSVAELDLRRDDDEVVRVTALKDKWARVVWETADVVVFGWVLRSALVKVGNSIGDAFGTGGLGLSGSGLGHTVKCAHSVDLHARVQGVERHVGTVPAGTLMGIHTTSGAATVVSFPKASVEASPGAEFLIDSTQLSDCR